MAKEKAEANQPYLSEPSIARKIHLETVSPPLPFQSSRNNHNLITSSMVQSDQFLSNSNSMKAAKAF